jgi:hypothetical protein
MFLPDSREYHETDRCVPSYSRYYYVAKSGSLSVADVESRRWALSFEYFHNYLKQIVADTFLPQGYPHSVRPEYLEYQFWDAAQGLCSYLRSVITTRSVFAAIGVGNSSISPLTAALTWIVNDGMGMIGSLTLAYSFSNSFEVYTKEWRFIADLLNNLGLTCDLACSFFPEYYQIFIAAGSISKSCCGLVAGATKARISSHFANKGYLADVNAKESTQETAVALIGIVFGTCAAKLIGEDSNRLSQCYWFFFFLLLHIYCNYRLMKVLVFHSINPQRAFIITSLSLHYNNKDQTNHNLIRSAILSPQEIKKQESLWKAVTLSLTAPMLGCSLQSIAWPDGGCQFVDLLKLWNDYPFVIGLNKRGRICICLQYNITEENVLKAYFVGCYLHLRLRECQKSKSFKWSLLISPTFIQEAFEWYNKIDKILISSESEWKEHCLTDFNKRYEINESKKTS